MAVLTMTSDAWPRLLANVADYIILTNYQHINFYGDYSRACHVTFHTDFVRIRDRTDIKLGSVDIVCECEHCSSSGDP